MRKLIKVALWVLAFGAWVIWLQSLTAQFTPRPHQADQLHLRANDFAQTFNEWALKMNEGGIHDMVLAKKVNRKFKRLQNCGAWPKGD